MAELENCSSQHPPVAPVVLPREQKKKEKKKKKFVTSCPKFFLCVLVSTCHVGWRWSSQHSIVDGGDKDVHVLQQEEQQQQQQKVSGST